MVPPPGRFQYDRRRSRSPIGPKPFPNRNGRNFGTPRDFKGHLPYSEYNPRGRYEGAPPSGHRRDFAPPRHESPRGLRSYDQPPQWARRERSPSPMTPNGPPRRSYPEMGANSRRDQRYRTPPRRPSFSRSPMRTFMRSNDERTPAGFNEYSAFRAHGREQPSERLRWSGGRGDYQPYRNGRQPVYDESPRNRRSDGRQFDMDSRRPEPMHHRSPLPRSRFSPPRHQLDNYAGPPLGGRPMRDAGGPSLPQYRGAGGPRQSFRGRPYPRR